MFKIKNEKFKVLFVVIFCLAVILTQFAFIYEKNAFQTVLANRVSAISNKKDISYDILDGYSGSCYSEHSEHGVVPYALENSSACDNYSSSHGPGREKGGIDLLSKGCRNYESISYSYGSSNIPYWVNMNSINEIADTNHKRILLSDISQQINLWNEAIMYDGTGQIVNLYEVDSGSTIKPEKINGKNVIEIVQRDLSESNAAGMFIPNELTVAINYNPSYTGYRFGYNIDTIVHEFGHVLGLADLERPSKNVVQGTHKTLMGYSRGTTPSTLETAIKYQDIQGVAVATGRHTCQNSHFKRYIKQGNNYLHICFYCDRIDTRTGIISGAGAMKDTSICDHEYSLMVSARNRYWFKCIKCYNVLESDNPDLVGLFGGGTGTESDPFIIHNSSHFRNMELAHRKVYIPRQGYEERINYSFKLTSNIYLGSSWVPFQYKFAGKFDGNKHCIAYSMTITQKLLERQYFGLFGFICSEAKIENFELVDCKITSDALTENRDAVVGILAGTIFEASGINNVKISNATIDCNIANAAIGGIAGTIFGTPVNNCIVSGGTIISYSGSLGGMAGLGDIGHFHNGSCTTTLTKNNYQDSDLIGNVVGNSPDYDSTVTCNVTINRNGGCVAAGTLITLADGRQVPVESLTGNEQLLVWNLYTGTYDTAPILFIDRDPEQTYRVINLAFSDGTSVKVIYEHGFWDYDLNRYVYLDKDAAQYIGHWFNKQTTDCEGNFASVRVQLTGVTISEEATVAYSPVTYGHLCYYVNGMLSMPGGIEGLFNTFEVDAETMRYDETKMAADIAEYGLFTYEEFAASVPVSQEAFAAFNGQYLKVALGKGLVSAERLQSLAIRYAEYLN